ncbi:2OG-Fe(II) oxyGenease [Xanthomonas phage XaC1]|nr:2OG-Fe(II) oxyGenease [Xanthomonas phage XaC1]
MFRWGNDKYSHLGYRIFTLAYCKRFDLYLFKYNEGSFIPKHKDPSFGMRHYRLNLVLKKPDKGGEFICNNKIFSIFNDRIMLFRADTEYHKITKVEKGTRWLLSLGIRL